MEKGRKSLWSIVKHDERGNSNRSLGEYKVVSLSSSAKRREKKGCGT